MIPLFSKATNKKLAYLAADYLDGGIVKGSLSVTRAINGEITAKFDYVPGGMGEALETETYVEIDGLLFDISYLEQRHGRDIIYAARCEHVIYRLLDIPVEPCSFEGTAAGILSEILAGTGFNAGGSEFFGEYRFDDTKSKNALERLRRFAGFVGGKLDYYGFSVGLRDTLWFDRGFCARIGKNINNIKRIIDRRKGLTYYQISLVDLSVHPDYSDIRGLESVAEGDRVRIVDEALGIGDGAGDTEHIVISRSYNPLDGMTVSLEIANRLELFTDNITVIEQRFESVEENLSAVKKDVSKVTNDLPDLVADSLYADNDMITDSLYADNGLVAELTVNALRTDFKRVRRYLENDVSPLNYIFIRDESYQMITAETDGGEIEQFVNAEGNPLWWNDGIIGGMVTTKETGEPVMVYVYNEYVKFDNSFDMVELPDGRNVVSPVIKIGAGVGDGDSGKMLIWKTGTSAHIKYITSDGFETELRAEDDGKWYYNDTEIGSVGTGIMDGAGHVLLDRMPVQADIDAVSEGTVVLVYDRTNPFIPSGA